MLIRTTPFLAFVSATVAVSLCGLSTRAQVVNDGATNTLSNVTNTITGDVTIGTNGSFTLLILSDNALLTNSVNGLIGRNATAKSNEVRLISPTARWQMGGSLFVGSNGALSRLVVSNGAFVENNSGSLATRIESSNNFALVTGSGSLWSNRLDLLVGGQGRGNQLIVSNGGWVANRSGNVGNNASASNNLAVVSGSGSVWSNRLDLKVGFLGSGNRLVIEAGGLVHCDAGAVGDFSSASNCEALVTGPGSLWTNASFLTIGSQTRFNRLVVSNGATVWSGSGIMGSTSAGSNNQVVVTGAGSAWSNQADLTLGGGSGGNRVDVNDGGAIVTGNGTIGSAANSNTLVLTGSGSTWNSQGGLIVGQAGNGNVLIASNGATVLSSNATIGVNGSTANNNLALLTGAGTVWSNTHNLLVGNSGVGNRLQVESGATVSSSNLFVGFNSLSANNRVTVDGGTLRVTNLAGNGTLDVRRGTNVLDAGLVEADRLLLTNAAGRFELNGGTLITYGAVISNGAPLVVGRSAVTPATWDVRAGLINHQLTGRLIVGSNASFNQVFITNGAVLDGNDYTFLAFNSGSNNAVTVSGPGSTLNSSFGFFIGADGNANRMLISNGGKVFANLGNSGTFIGRSVGTRSNTVAVTDPGSRWSVNDTLYVGSGGNGNQLVVSNGGAVDSLVGYVGSASSNNLALVSGANSSWSNRSECYVGASGGGNRLLVTEGGTVINSNATLGLNMSSHSNSVLVSGAGTLWNNRSDLLVGRDGRFNQLIVSDGGTVISGNGRLGFSGLSGDNTALVTGAGSLWTNLLDLHVGQECTFNLLVVSNQAQVMNRSGFVGFGTVNGDNGAVVTGLGSVWNNSQDLIVGNDGITANDNWLLVTNGGMALAGRDGIVGLGAASFFNQATVTDPLSRWLIGRDLYVGSSGAISKLIVTNGGVVTNLSGYLGFNASGGDAVVQISGTGSAWINGSQLLVGNLGRRNQLIVSNSAVVSVGSAVFVGAGTSSTNNRVEVNGSMLLVTNASGTGLLDIRRGTNVLNAGLIDVDILRMTNALSRFEFNGGTLAVKSSRVSIGPPLVVGNGVSSATFNLTGDGTHDFSGTLGLIVSSNATLTGNGSLVVQLQVRPGAQLVPGAPVGNINLSTPPGLQGAVVMELTKNGTVLDYDQIQVSGTLTYGGALIVTNLGPTALAAGDRFKLFSAGSYAGSFTSLTLPPLSPGLRWGISLQVDGSIEVFAPPTIGAGFALSFDGTNDFVDVSNDSRLNSYPLVATAWINTTQATGEVGIINKYLAGSLNGWQLALVNGQVRAWYIRDNANYVWDGGLGLNGGPVNNGEWYHVAFTVDASGGHLYVDGFLKDSLPWTGTAGACTTTQVLSLARYPGGAGEFFQGMMDEVAVWHFVGPTQGEIKTNRNRGLIGSESGLVLYLRLNEGTDNFAENAAAATGNFVSTLQNGVTWVPGLVLRPAVLTKIATAIAVNSALLHGIVNPGHTNTSAWFEWGTTPAYGNFTPAQSLGSGGGNTNFSQTITGLTENVTYHFRAIASNSVGASFGADRSFVATGTNMLTPRAFHTATLLPTGKVLVAGGLDQDSQTVSSAELYDPATGMWVVTSPMSTPRYLHTATLLPNGKVLVVGAPANSSAELYDPATGTWSLTGSMGTNRIVHTATLLSNGKVLVAGGLRDTFNDAIAELYDPATGTWTETGALLGRRFRHSATLLPNGKVLLAGGRDINNVTVSSAELYDPVSGIWTDTGSMTTNRENHTATLLRSGQVLVVGGQNPPNSLRSAELYDPVTGTWAATGAMLNSRFSHTATLLPNGKVFASGNGIGLASVYDPGSGTWTDVPGSDPDAFVTATLLPDGSVLLAGGLPAGAPTAEARVVEITNGSWTTTAPMATARDGHSATLLPEGRVLVAGLTNSELYNPITDTWSPTAALITGRYSHTATLLPNGKVLAAGGQNNVGSPLASSELYNPATGAWTNTGSFSSNRFAHRATLLPNGKVLVTGGNNGFFTPPLRTAELYDPVTGTWNATGLMTTNRSGHSATLLPNGKVLIAGGIFEGGSLFPRVLSSAELYEPSNGSWTAISSMSTNRSGHLAVLLPNGKVLVAGGSADSFSANFTAELYDPATETWQATSLMITGRQSATATLLPNGEVLVAGGYNVNLGGYLSSAELYDPTFGKWRPTPSLGAAHISHTSTLLPDGRVLVTGGYLGSGNTNRVELYNVPLGFSNSWRPQITGITSPLSSGSSLVVTGAQFRGLSQGSGGTSQDSPTDHPIVKLHRLDNEQTLFVLSTSWSTNLFTSAPVLGFLAGPAMATVIVNGIPSLAIMLNVIAAAPTPFPLTDMTITAGGAFAFGFTNTPNSTFTVLASANVALPLSNWTILGTVTETSPGQYQFIDTNAPSFPTQFYRAVSP